VGKKARNGGKRGRDPYEAERRQAWQERQELNCEGKTGYATENAARQSAGWVKAQNPSAHQMKVYNCPHCGKWHLTNRGVRPR